MKTLIALAVSGLFAASAMAGEIDKLTAETDNVVREATSKFVHLDVDHDSSLTEMEITDDTEFADLDSDAFADADINQDGKLNHDEFIALYKNENEGKQYSSAPVEEDPMNHDNDEDEDQDQDDEK
jgi:hypothetical protein